MPRVPFVSRLHLREYFALTISIVLIFLESLISIITLALPGPIITFCYRLTRRAFNYLSSPQGKRLRNKKRDIVHPIAQASDFVELCELFGYYAEEHIVQTGDGYLLGLHRLGYKRGEDGRRVNSGEDSIRKKVVYMHHGLMMNSEVWVCLTERERCLPFMLVDRGYDVWLGNNRGNKYSKKNVHYPPTDIKFWDFSIDQFAFHDIPDSISYILQTTGQPSLSYIGFSQGTAQAFATLSIHPVLNEKVDVFVALAPAMSPKGLTSGIVDSFVKTSPEVLFLAFGRRAILGSATMWEAILYPPIFVRFIDVSLSFLFGWKATNITPHQKLAAYPHLYSFTSTKSVVHWFQIIRNGKFQMYDDEVQAPLSFPSSNKYTKVAKFPTRNIKTPIVLVYGGSDSLVDIDVMLSELPKHTVAKEIAHYEHLDFLWASSVDKLVFPHVFQALETYTDPDKRRRARSGSSFHYPHGGNSGLLRSDSYTNYDDSSSSAAANPATKISDVTSAASYGSLSSGRASAQNQFPRPATPMPQKRLDAEFEPDGDRNGKGDVSMDPATPMPLHPPFHSPAVATHPEDWLSTEEISGNTGPGGTPSNGKHLGSGSGSGSGSGTASPSGVVTSPMGRKRTESRGSLRSIEQRGISLGAGRATTGFVSGAGVGEGSPAASAMRKKSK